MWEELAVKGRVKILYQLCFDESSFMNFVLFSGRTDVTPLNINNHFIFVTEKCGAFLELRTEFQILFRIQFRLEIEVFLALNADELDSTVRFAILRMNLLKLF